MYKVAKPRISTKELIARYRHIKPIVTNGGKEYFLREYTVEELRKRSYTWHIEEDIEEEVDMSKYKTIERIPYIDCIHKTGVDVTIFTPKIADILAQIPRNYVEIVSAFTIAQSYRFKEAHEEYRNIFENGYNVSRVRLYVKVSD